MFYFQEFWLVCGLWCGVGSALFLKFKLNGKEDLVGLTTTSLNSFLIAYIFTFLLPFTALYILTISQGEQATIDITEWPDNYKFMSFGVIWATLIFVNLWAWLRNGAALLAKIHTVVYEKRKFVLQSSELKVKAGLLLMFIPSFYEFYRTLS